ncbi:hypothetical protein KKB18_03370, partial [bacterium]|nr:hypothetical protein [bacterium]
PANAIQIGIYTDSSLYSKGETVKVDFYIYNDKETLSYDIYIALLVPSNDVYFFPGWVPIVTPIQVTLSAGFLFEKQTVFEFQIPTTTPPIGDEGSYIFATAVSKTGQTYFETEIQTAPFQIKNETEVVCYTNGNKINELLWHEGYLLACTTGGLVLWDSSNDSYQKITTQDGLAGGDVRGILYDQSKGGFWIATNGGISFYDSMTITNYTTENGFDTDDILSIALDGNNKLWCGTNGYGVNILSNGQVISRVDSSDYLPDDVVLSLCRDKSNLMWVGTANGAASFDGYNWTRYTNLINAGINGSIIRKIAVDQNNTKYFAVANANDEYGGNGVSVFDGQDWTYYRDTGEDDLIDDSVFDIYIDNSNNIWFATWLGLSGLQVGGEWTLDGWGYWTTSVTGGNDKIFYGTKFDGIGKKYQNTGYFLTTTNEPVSNGISSFGVDNNNKIWMGTNQPILGGEGVSKFDGSQFISYNLSYISNNVRSIAIRQDNTVFAGTDKGLGYLIDNEWNKLTTDDGLLSNIINCLAVDQYGKLWIGTPSGLNIYYQNAVSEAPSSSDLPGDNITDIFVDQDNRVWVATTTGVGIYENGNWRKLYYRKQLFTGWMFSITVDKNGIGWGGLFENFVRIDLSYETDQVDFLVNTPQMAEFFAGTTISDISTDNDGNIWLASDSKGLISYNPTNMTYYSIETKNGLASNTINAILIDSANHIWCGTSNGITIVLNP